MIAVLRISLLTAMTQAAANAQDADVNRAAGAEWIGTQASALQTNDTLKIGGYTKFRYNLNSRDDVPSGKDSASGFTNADTSLIIDGTVDRFGYHIWSMFPTDGNLLLHKAFVSYEYTNGWTIMAGQMTAPFTREEFASDTGLLAVARSVKHSVWTVGRVQGITALKTNDDYRFWVSINDGRTTHNTDFTSPIESDYAFTARGEYKWAGDDWSVFDDFTSFRGSSMSGMAGAAIHYQSGGDTFAVGTGATLDNAILDLTGDVTIEGAGWSAFADVQVTQTDPAIGDSFTDWGLLVQGSYFVDESWEVFGRYDGLFPENQTDFGTVTVGVNKYFIPESHAAKLTADVQYFLDEQAGSSAPPNTHNVLLASDQDGQWGLRLQLQLVF